MASEEKTEKSSPTTSGPDSDIGSVKELPQDEETGIFLDFLPASRNAGLGLDFVERTFVKKFIFLPNSSKLLPF